MRSRVVPCLLLQQLTYNDINNYVRIELVDSERFVKLKTKDPSGCAELASSIVEKAEGVFLWVFLVVRDLMQGLRNEDGLRDLRRRLELIPADLEQYFAQQMMSTLDSFYLEQAAQLFQVALHTDQAASLLTYSFLHEEDPDYAIKLKVEPLKTAEVCDRFVSMERCLNSRCKGLLEVHDRKSEDLSFSCRVGFLHRTIRDFLRTNILRDILSGSRSEAFDVSLLLCKLFIAQIKSLSEISNQKYFLLLLNQFLLYAGNLEAERNESPTALLDELDRSAGILFADRTTCTLFTSPILSDDHWTNHLHDGAAGHQGGWKIHSSKVFDSMPKRKLSKNRSSYLQSKDVHC